MPYGGIFDYDDKAHRLHVVNAELEDPNVWDNPQHAQDLGREKKSLENVVHVLDASRSVTVAGSLLNADSKKNFLDEIREGYLKLSNDFANKKTVKKYLPLHEAQQNKVAIDWKGYTPVAPSFTGAKAFKEIDLQELTPYIDWQPFFIAWELHGKFPDILSLFKMVFTPA